MRFFKKLISKKGGLRGAVSLLVLTAVLGVVNFVTRQSDKDLIEVIKKPVPSVYADSPHYGSDSDGGDSDGGDSDGGGSGDSTEGGNCGCAESNGDTCL